MLIPLRAMIIKDIKLISRQRLLLVLLMVYPFILTGIVALTFNGGRLARLGIVAADDVSGSKIWLEGEPLHARELISRYAQGSTSVRFFGDEPEAIEALRNGGVDAVLVLPDDFVEKLKTLDESANIKAYVDETNPWMAATSENVLRGVISKINRLVVEEKMNAVNAGLQVLVTGGDFFGNEVIGMKQVISDLEDVRAALQDPALSEKLDEELRLAWTIVEDLGDAADYLRATAIPVELEIKGSSGKSVRLDSSAMPFILGISMLWTGMLSASVLLAMEEESGMRRRLQSTPAGGFQVIASKTLVSVGIVLMQTLLIGLIAFPVTDLPLPSVPAALAVVLLATLSSVGVGLLVAAYIRETSGAVMVSVMLCLPMLFLSGAVFPLSQMPQLLRAASRFLPFTWAFDSLAGVLVRNDAASETMKSSFVMAMMGALLMTLGFLVFRRRD